MSDWKPGDVAMFCVTRWGSACEWPDDTSRVLMRLDSDGRYWSAVEGDPTAPFRVHAESRHLRPLVVIDPEDAEQTSRLWRSLPQDLVSIDQLEDALREFANPTPPKPDEPTGLGAVIEDAEGRRWVRDESGPDEPRAWYRRGEGSCRAFSDLTAVRVLSPGVEADS